MNFGLTHRTTLVLGGGGGLGRAICKVLAGEGANVAIADIAPDAIAGTQEALATAAGKTIGLVWDLSDLTQIDAHVSRIEAELGPVDVLVNITGGPPPTPASGQDPALWAKHFQSMVLSVIAITDRVLPNMRARHWGRVITSTSSGVVMPIPNLGISNALRLSLVGWSKTLSREVGKDGIGSGGWRRLGPGHLESADGRRSKRRICRHRTERHRRNSGGVGSGGRQDHWPSLGSFRSDADRCACIEG